jgi:predicted nucleic acid-binding protein
MVTYFDSSILLSILLEETRGKEAYSYWTKSKFRTSSILLKIETIVSLRRFYELNTNKLSKEWLLIKTQQLSEFLKEADYYIVGTAIERIILKNDKLAKCRSLDAIHIATALKLREENKTESTSLYTFDSNMHALAEEFGFEVNSVL